ncbi:MAG: hypothetical protein JXX14_09745 [Deltaproteobacteria bacterium]|nr:hypothetical protein [Deltaproteobacteria bacterium]
MDQYQRAYWEMAFKARFLESKGMAFQNFFAEVMEKGYPYGDFLRVRPWGQQGDRKNDGYLSSKRTLFQVYAPNELKESVTISKIEEDFTGALPWWKEFFDTWVFVHNSREGLSPGVTSCLLSLKKEQKDISIQWWGFEELRKELFKLDAHDIGAILGPAPMSRDFVNIGFDKIKPILDTVSRAKANLEVTLSTVPRDKVEINRLSENTEVLIQAGRRRSDVVDKFFAVYPDPQFGDDVVQAFRQKYEHLRDAQLEPDRIFQELQKFAGGEAIGEPAQQAAVLTVLAYLFDRCDIFESIRKDK